MNTAGLKLSAKELVAGFFPAKRRFLGLEIIPF